MAEPSANPLVSRCADAYAARAVPVLRATVETLAQLARRADSVKPRDIAVVVLRDPMLTLAVLRHLRSHHSRRMLEDITTVEHAIMMLGVGRFFESFGALPVAGDAAGADASSLAGLMDVACRARAASMYAGMLAGLRGDAVPEEVAVAALLHDLAEMLLWCHEPARAAAISGSLAAQPGLRSADAQERVLGFRLADLQLALARRWDLPELILSLMDDGQAERARVRCVALSVALARHAAHGWRNPALPSDLAGIAKLAAVTVHEAEAHVFDTTLRVVIDRARYGAAPPNVPLPLLPRPAPQRVEAGAEVPPPAAAYELSLSWLERLARGQPLTGRSRSGIARDARHEQLAAITALLDGITDGLGFRVGHFLVPGGSRRWRPLYVGGDVDTVSADFPRGDPAAAAFLATVEAAGPGAARQGVICPEGSAGLLGCAIVCDDGPCAVALGLGPLADTSLAPDSLNRLKTLAGQFELALKGSGERPYWLALEG